jgi:hypothetical protein
LSDCSHHDLCETFTRLQPTRLEFGDVAEEWLQTGKAVNLLPCNIMPLCNLRYRRAAYAGRQHNLELLVLTPTPPPFRPKNIATHYQPPE